MRKILLFTLFVIFVLSLFCFIGCDNRQEENTSTSGQTSQNNDDEKEIKSMYISINGNKLEVTLAKNSSVDALIQLLKQGDITYTADDYGGFEKVGNIGNNIPRSDTRITTEAGDVMLYLGNQICIFVGSNSWDYTRIGKINGYTTQELRTLIGSGKGSMQVTLSLN